MDTHTHQKIANYIAAGAIIVSGVSLCIALKTAEEDRTQARVAAETNRGHARAMTEYQTTSEILMEFSLADRPTQVSFLQMLVTLEAQDGDNDIFPMGILDLLEQAIADNPVSETSDIDDTALAATSEELPMDPGLFNATLTRLLADDRRERVAARTALAEQISTCNDPICAQLILETLPAGPSLTGSSYRATLGLAIAISRQSDTAFLTDDSLRDVRIELTERLQDIAGALDPTLRAYAGAAATVVDSKT